MNQLCVVDLLLRPTHTAHIRRDAMQCNFLGLVYFSLSTPKAGDASDNFAERRDATRLAICSIFFRPICDPII